jgi:hypothetical protein
MLITFVGNYLEIKIEFALELPLNIPIILFLTLNDFIIAISLINSIYFIV